MVTRKVAAALAAGNTVVVSLSPLSLLPRDVALTSHLAPLSSKLPPKLLTPFSQWPTSVAKLVSPTV